MRQMKFGAELEVATSKSRYEVIEALQNAGINVEGDRYGSPVNHNAWKVQPDASINGWEIVSPPLTDTEELKTVVHVLRKELKVRCNKKTGLHVHHDINDFNINQIKNLYRLYNKYERNAIYSIINPSRRISSYCSPIAPIMENVESASNIEEFKNSIRSRYYNLNNRAYVKYGTIEFRHHQGTTNINEILAWIEFTHKLVETAANIQEMTPLQSSNNEEALDEMLEEVGLSDNKPVVKQFKRAQRYIAKLA
jgi:hypothetical protein